MADEILMKSAVSFDLLADISYFCAPIGGLFGNHIRTCNKTDLWISEI
jgi:hypothetical protein